MKIEILYGTETGNAEMLAEDIKSALEADHEITCSDMADTDPAALSAGSFHIFVCSTYGDGELPASARPFAERLSTEQPVLSGVHFAIFGLGDTEYAETFANGPKTIAATLESCGAIRVGSLAVHDASGGELAEDLALPWISEILTSDSVQSKGF